MFSREYTSFPKRLNYLVTEQSQMEQNVTRVFIFLTLIITCANAHGLREVKIHTTNATHHVEVNGVDIGAGSSDERTLFLPDSGCYLITERNDYGEVIFADTLGRCIRSQKFAPLPHVQNHTLMKESYRSTADIRNVVHTLSIGAGVLVDAGCLAPSIRVGVNANRKRYMGLLFSYISSGDRDKASTLPTERDFTEHEWHRFFAFGLEYERLFTPTRPLSFIMGAYLGGSYLEHLSIENKSDSYYSRRPELTMNSSEYASALGYRIGINFGRKALTVKLTGDVRLGFSTYEDVTYLWDEEENVWSEQSTDSPMFPNLVPLKAAFQLSINYHFKSKRSTQ